MGVLCGRGPSSKQYTPRGRGEDAMVGSESGAGDCKYRGRCIGWCVPGRRQVGGARVLTRALSG